MKLKRFPGPVVLIFALPFLCACQTLRQQPPFVPSVNQPPIAHLMMPSDSLDSVYSGLEARDLVYKLYKRKNYQSLWIDAQNHSAADSLIQFIKRIEYHGLYSQWYHGEEIEAIKNDGRKNNSERLDAILTDSFLRISHDLKYGRTNRYAQSDTSLVNTFFQPQSIRAYFLSLEPNHREYQELMKVLKSTLDSVRVTSDDLNIENQSTSTPFHLSPIQKLQINMERWRLVSASLGDRYILVNIPAYMLYVIRNDTAVFESKVIVGAVDSPTPELTSKIDCIITYPYWYVPKKIAVEEYLPVIQADISFLRRNHFDVIDRKGNVLHADSIHWIDFNKDYFPVSLRQREGPENSLGVLKFNFDNPYAVFLHDTNAPRLFRNKERAFSHGCIRIDKANELAHFLLTGDFKIKSKWLEKTLKEEERKMVSLKNPISIHVSYFTCEFNGKSLVFYKDLYEKDKALYALLLGKDDFFNP